MRGSNFAGNSMAIPMIVVMIVGNFSGCNDTRKPGPAQASRKFSTSALYLQHIGMADKPIFPTVICVTSPPREELEGVLGIEWSERATILKISESDLSRLLADTINLLKDFAPPQDSSAYGTFRVTVIQGERETRQTVSLANAASLLSAIEKDVGPGYPELKSHVSTLKRRLS